jgi:predicted nucleotidyltransferase
MITQEVNPEVLREIVRRIVTVAQPERIILFGSAARGALTADSDVDVLVVKANVHRRKLAQAIYLNLIGVGRAVDVVVATPEDLEQYRDTPGLIIAPALRDGKVIYERSAVSG